MVRDFLGRDEAFSAFSDWLNEEFEETIASLRVLKNRRFRYLSFAWAIAARFIDSKETDGLSSNSSASVDRSYLHWLTVYQAA
jgi:hypothetical protein